MRRKYFYYLMIFAFRFEGVLAQCKYEGQSEEDLEHFYQAEIVH